MFEFSGIDQLIREVENLEKIDDSVKNDALKEGADVVKKSMQQEVYAHGLHQRTGAARESITRSNPKSGEVFIGPNKNGFYLYFHEFGFFNVRAQKFISPTPFASIAFENAKEQVLETQAQVVKRKMGL